ncbi:outer membrane receptor protein involved in Fe transport [Sphingomonas sp. BK235]|nr:outer membrane receptor protein involved in Fe transport [Sphingomonas sp. BK235]
MTIIRNMLATTALSAAMLLAGAAAADPGDDRTSAAESVSTGVAVKRDPLDSATSTSVLHEAEIERLGARSVGDLLRNVPGLRSESASGEGNNNLTVRGLPISASGAKFIQLQEDGLPVMEYSDIIGTSGDSLIRTDLMLSQVEVIRGGSASTFASNSPGGVINFRTKTGEQDGGAVALGAGLDYNSYRADFTYGGHLSDTLRFQAGGFYRQGDGPRRIGYDAQKGGQARLNVTKEFSGGYVRLYGKYLDDRTPYYDAVPFLLHGSERRPRFEGVKGFDALHDSLGSSSLRDFRVLDRTNRPIVADLGEGQRIVEHSVGVEAQFDIAGWTVTERLRYAGISGELTAPFNTVYGYLDRGKKDLGGEGAVLTFVGGARAGQAISFDAPSPLNGNGLIRAMASLHMPIHDYDDVTNELRVTRVFDTGPGELTTTAGFYAARQTIDRDTLWATQLADVRGHGESALINITTATGYPLTDDGTIVYGNYARLGGLRRSVQTDNAINAPFGSLNYHLGRFSVGGSLRYDYGSVRGRSWRSGGPQLPAGFGPFDVNQDGKISFPETLAEQTNVAHPSPVGYHYHYLSYSTGLTYRLFEPLAFFARYSKGARTGADRLLFTAAIDDRTGGLTSPSVGINTVRQAEGGFKFRQGDVTLNLTGFWAKTFDSNYDPIRARPLQRDYRASGLEFEGNLRFGVLGLSGGATYTDAKIVHDYIVDVVSGSPDVAGHRPRHQPRWIFQATPEIVTDRVAIGATFLGATRSFAQDENALTIPGYVTTNGFVQLRATEKLRLTINANNLFNNLALMGVDNAVLPNGVALPFVRGRPLTGRTVSATLRLDF